MISELKNKVAGLEKELSEAKEELQEAITQEVLLGLQGFLGKCCVIRAKGSDTYLIDVRKIDVDENESGWIIFEAEKIVVVNIDPTFPDVTLDEMDAYYVPDSGDIVEEIKKEDMWGKIGESIKKAIEE